MKPVATDTSPEATAKYFSLLRSLSSVERMRIVDSLCAQVRSLVEAGIRAEHPAATPEELRVRTTVRYYGRDVALRPHGQVPDDAR